MEYFIEYFRKIFKGFYSKLVLYDLVLENMGAKVLI